MKSLFAATIMVLGAGSAIVQAQPANQNAVTPGTRPSTTATAPTTTAPATTAPAATSSTTSHSTASTAAPVAGANSFTESQAKSRIEAAGYSDVSGLAKDTNGVWRGKAAKAGKNVDVALDYQGNITAR